MKKITKLFVVFSLALIVLCGCTRTYSDGYAEQVSPWTMAYDIIFGKPARKAIEPLTPMKLTGDPALDAKAIAFNAHVEAENKRIAKYNEGAQSDKENPDDGLIELIGLAMTAGGLGWAKTFISKRNAEKIRDLAIVGEKKASVRYQAAKEAVRSDDDLLEKVRDLAQIAEYTVDDYQEIYAKHGDTIEGTKRALKEIQRKNS